MLCSHWLMNYLSAVYTLLFTLQLRYKPLAIQQRVTKSRIAHIKLFILSENWQAWYLRDADSYSSIIPYIKSCWITKLFNINLSYHRFKGFQEWGQSNRNPFFPYQILNLSSNRSFIFWLQSIHHINTCRKPWFPMNVSLILTLIVEATLSLVQQVFIDSVNFIVQTCNFRNKQIWHYSLMKETAKLHQLLTSPQVNLEVCLKEFWKCVLLNRAPTSIQLYPNPPSSSQFHPPPPSSFQPSPNSLQHPQQYSNQNIARNGAKFRRKNSKLSILTENWLTWYLECADSEFRNFEILNFEIDILTQKSIFLANLGPKSQICSFCPKTGAHSISRMLILIPALYFWISHPKIRF